MFVTPTGFVHVQFILNCHADLCKFAGSHSLFVLQLAFHPAALQLQVHGPVHDTAVAVHAVHSSPHDGAFTLVLPFAVQQDQVTFATQLLPFQANQLLQIYLHSVVLAVVL